MNEKCPSRDTYIGEPGAFHGKMGQVMHTHRTCECGAHLIWFNEGELATGWRVDETPNSRDYES